MLELQEYFIVGKQFSRKESTDSGISAGSSSRKTSTTSSLGTREGILEEPSEETIKEETPFTEPDEDLCEKITQQVMISFTLSGNHYLIVTKTKHLILNAGKNCKIHLYVEFQFHV